MVKLLLTPSKITKNRGQSFLAITENGDFVVDSPSPFFNGARALLEMGYSPEEELTAQHSGQDFIAMRSTIGEAAKWAIREHPGGQTEKVRYVPMPEELKKRNR